MDVVFDAAGLADGAYSGSLCLISDDPQNPQLAIPVTMTVDACASQVPAAVSLMATRLSESDLQLSWTGDPANYGYTLYRSTEPYFDVDGAVWVADFPAGDGSYTASGILGDGSDQHYILVSENCNGTLTAPSINTMGTFDYPILPGE